MRADLRSSLFDKALDAVVGMDVNGSVIAWNPSAEALFGWSAGKAIGRRMSDLIIPEQHRAEHERGLHQYNATGEGPVLDQRLKVTALRKVGPEFPIELSIVSLPEGGRTVFYAFIRSLEEEERVERERRWRTLEAEVMAAISAAQLEDIDLDEFIRLCIRNICEVSGWAAGHLYRIENAEGTAQLVPSEIWHIADPSLGRAREVSSQFRFAKDVGLPGTAWGRDDVVVVENLETEPNFLRREAFRGIGLAKAFAFPIRNPEGISGVMEFFGGKEARTDDELRMFARTIASHVRLAIRRKHESEQRELLRRELAHRVGNSLAVLSSVFRRCCKSAGSVEELQEAFESRLLAVGHAHRMVAERSSVAPAMHGIVERAIEILPERNRVSVKGPPLALSIRAVLPMTLVLHELVTNSIKYGSWHIDGSLRIEWTSDDDDLLEFEWCESPTSHHLDMEREGYGTTLIRAMIEGTLRGSVQREATGGSYRVRIGFPLHSEDSADDAR